jgi:Protein of unknown function (DUF3800)
MSSNLSNIYCDESCHLENDRESKMLLGAVWAPKDRVSRLVKELKEIKRRFSACGELKWSKVSKSRLNFFMAVIDWFFLEPELHFRGIVISNKHLLNHRAFNHNSHDDFYYKMYYSLLSKILSPDCRYRIFFDIKDTRSRSKLNKLKDVLCNDRYDFTGQMIEEMQHVRSNEVELIQLTDFLLGAVSYKNRECASSEFKLAIVNQIEHRSSRPLTRSTSLSEKKFNLFIWTPKANA